MNIAKIFGAIAFAAVLSVAAAAHAEDAAAPAAAAPAAATEKCEVTKDGNTTVVDVAVGTCEKEGGKLVTAEGEKK
jgi:hypothetical protein